MTNSTVRKPSPEPTEPPPTYGYDAINRLSEKVDPLGAVTQFRYDAKGNLTGTTDAEAAENSYLYDAIDWRNSRTAYTERKGIYDRLKASDHNPYTLDWKLSLGKAW